MQFGVAAIGVVDLSACSQSVVLSGGAIALLFEFGDPHLQCSDLYFGPRIAHRYDVGGVLRTGGGRAGVLEGNCQLRDLCLGFDAPRFKLDDLGLELTNVCGVRRGIGIDRRYIGIGRDLNTQLVHRVSAFLQGRTRRVEFVLKCRDTDIGGVEFPPRRFVLPPQGLGIQFIDGSIVSIVDAVRQERERAFTTWCATFEDGDFVFPNDELAFSLPEPGGRAHQVFLAAAQFGPQDAFPFLELKNRVGFGIAFCCNRDQILGLLVDLDAVLQRGVALRFQFLFHPPNCQCELGAHAILLGTYFFHVERYRRFDAASGEMDGTIPDGGNNGKRKNASRKRSERNIHGDFDHALTLPVPFAGPHSPNCPDLPSVVGFYMLELRRAQCLNGNEHAGAALERVPGRRRGELQIPDIEPQSCADA